MRRAALIAGIFIAVFTMSTVGAIPAQAAGDTSPYRATYGTFTSVSKSGRSDSIFTLPSGAKAGIIIARYSGDSNFIVEGLDARKHLTALPVNTIGDYAGTTAFGLQDWMPQTRSIRVKARGAWSIQVKQISRAPFLQKTGRTDGVFLYGGMAKNVRMVHRGSGNFIVQQTARGTTDLVVNEIGSYSGTNPLVKGPSVIEVNANGAWSIK